MKWSVFSGTSWVIVDAVDADAAKLVVLRRLGRTRPIYDGHRWTVAPGRPEFLDVMSAREATASDLATFHDLADATEAEGGRAARLARLTDSSPQEAQ